MSGSYVLMTRTPSKKQEDFYRWDFIYFPDYLSLQKHLMKFPYKQNNEFIIYKETNIKRDKSLEVKTKKVW